MDWLPTTSAWNVPSSSKDFFHLRIKLSPIPKSLATAVYDKPCSMTFLTSASLYSRLNVRRLSMDRFSCQRSLTCAGPLSTFRGQFHFIQDTVDLHTAIGSRLSCPDLSRPKLRAVLHCTKPGLFPISRRSCTIGKRIGGFSSLSSEGCGAYPAQPLVRRALPQFDGRRKALFSHRATSAYR
ncbi:hypothetical protein RB4298 [Rhodopirellula baltica SH 1]|uniref:Uncharacterized protein n=1 Tax=Rhodopirellula baltica (strain DSM 10527 / NCIMB 13988 / SH1) TaxID=243090 RepID=Q7USU1_RHOBA|nr:hypothetical protein RB4298 [Rhodopirellula baltica SH 1]